MASFWRALNHSTPCGASLPHMRSGEEYQLGDFMSERMSDVWQFREQVPHDGQRWGKWRFDEKGGGLEYEDGNNGVRIDLTTIDGSARMLDWIFWMSGHEWFTRHDLADLVEAFDDIFYPRGNLCPNGQDQPMDANKYLHVLSGMGKWEQKAA